MTCKTDKTDKTGSLQGAAIAPEHRSYRIDEAALHDLYNDLLADNHHDIQGVVIGRDSEIVWERYFNGTQAESLHDIRSATKSITAILVGIAVDQGIMRDVDEPILKYFPGHSIFGKEAIRIRDLLTMRAGLAVDEGDPASPGHESQLDKASDFVEFALRLPMADIPGTVYRYASVTAFLAGALVENASGVPLDQFGEINLFGPLAISDYCWRRGPKGRITGQGNLRISARDAAKIGMLALFGGMFAGRRILSEGWLRDCLAPHVHIGAVDTYADHYGYMWYAKTHRIANNEIAVFFASGNGGNKIYVIPSRRLVIAVTSSAYDKPHGQRRAQDILLRIMAAT